MAKRISPTREIGLPLTSPESAFVGLPRALPPNTSQKAHLDGSLSPWYHKNPHRVLVTPLAQTMGRFVLRTVRAETLLRHRDISERRFRRVGFVHRFSANTCELTMFSTKLRGNHSAANVGYGVIPKDGRKRRHERIDAEDSHVAVNLEPGQRSVIFHSNLGEDHRTEH